MKVTVIPLIINAPGSVPKDLVRGLEELEIGRRAKACQNRSLQKSARILRRVLETCCHFDSSERPSGNADGKKTHEEL